MKQRYSLLALAWLGLVLPARAQRPGPWDEPQYLKAERALEAMKQGKVPYESPDTRWEIFRDVFIGYMETEEFKAMTPDYQSLIRAYTDRMNDQFGAERGAPAAQPSAAWAKQQYHFAFAAAARQAQPYAAGPCDVIFVPLWSDPNGPITRAMDKRSQDWFIKSKRKQFFNVCIDGNVERPTHLLVWLPINVNGSRVISWPTYSGGTVTGPDGEPIGTVSTVGSVPLQVPSTTTYLTLLVVSQLDGNTEEAWQHPVWSGHIVVGGSRDRAAEKLFQQAIKFLATSPALK